MGIAVEVQESLAAKFAALFPHLDERQRRLVAGAEARAPGHGGIGVVARAAGMRQGTVSRGVAELESGQEPLGRARRPGGGRSGWLSWIRGCRRGCWRWWSRICAGIRSRRCGGRQNRCGCWRPS